MVRRIIIFTVLVGLTSCSRFVSIQRNPDADVRYNAAMDYYDESDFYRAGLLFEELIPTLIGSAKAEKVQFYYAYCQFNQQQYQLSAHYFKSFYDTYRRSDRAEEAIYMHAYSMYLGTPQYNLDQSGTDKAISALQDVINLYPSGEFAEKAFTYIQKLRARLEQKSFDLAKQYLTLGRYKAAVVALDNFRKDFPDSQMREEAGYKRLEAQYELAKISIQSLKQERYQQLVDDYLIFVERYDKSEYIKKAEALYVAAQGELEKM